MYNGEAIPCGREEGRDEGEAEAERDGRIRLGVYGTVVQSIRYSEDGQLLGYQSKWIFHLASYSPPESIVFVFSNPPPLPSLPSPTSETAAVVT